MNPQLSERVQNLSGSVAREILSRAQDCDIVSFAGGLPDATLWSDLDLPPIPYPSYQYGPSEGDRALRSLLATRAVGYGIPASEERTIVTTGSQQGLDLAAKLLIDKGSRILVESPTYLAALQVFKLFQASIHELPLDENGITPDSLDQALATHKPRLVYLNPSYQNPTGICYPSDRRREIASVLDRHSAVLVEDEPYRELAYGAATPPPISGFLKQAEWIHLSSVSKTLIPGLRLGSLACSATLYPHLLKLKQAADLHSSRIAQHLASELLADSQAQRERVQKTIRSYRTKRDAMQRVLEQHFPAIADWSLPEGGMFFWLTLKKRIDLAQSLETALTQNIAFMPGTPFFAAPEKAAPSIRLNFTQPSLEQIETHLPRLAQILSTRHPSAL